MKPHRTWLPQVGLCLLMQGGIVLTGVLLQHWLADTPKPLDQQVVL
jgi:hypothetical protein